MTQFEIHNGEVIVDGKVQTVTVPESPVEACDLSPDGIAAVMARVISIGITDKITPIEIVTRLLQLKSPKGQKLVWTRFDLFQMFAIWSKKLSGESKVA